MPIYIDANQASPPLAISEPYPQVLYLAPTYELAIQIGEVAYLLSWEKKQN